MNQEHSDVRNGCRKGRGTRDQIAIICLLTEKAEFQKNIHFSFIDYAKASDCVDHNKLWEILKETGIPDHLTCLLWNLCVGHTEKKQQLESDMEQQTFSKLGKEYIKAVCCHPVIKLYAECIKRNAKLDEAQAGIKTARRNVNLRYADDTTLVAESQEEPKSPLMKVKEESEKVGLKLSTQKTKIMASGPITSWQIDGETMETVRDFIFLGSKITAHGDYSHEIKRHLLLRRKAMTNLEKKVKVKVTQSCPTLYEPWTIQSMELSRSEY